MWRVQNNTKKGLYKMEITLTSENFKEVVMNSDKPVLIDFWATWCGPCKMIAPIIAEIADERDDIVVCKSNVDEEPELAERFGVRFIPHLAVIKNGETVAETSGYLEKEQILSLLEAKK